MGKQVPATLIRQIEEDKRKETQEDHFNNFRNTNSEQNNITHFAQPQLNQNSLRQPQQPPHKYSPQYAAYVGAKPRAQASAKIGLGGVF